MHPGQHLTRPPDQPPGRYLPYAGPPPTAPHDPGIAPQQPPYAYGWGSYPSPYPYAYPYPAAAGPRRPGTLTAAAVLGFVNGGLLIIAAMILFSGASLIAGIDNSEDVVDLSGYTAELTLDGFVDLVAAGLLIAGGVALTSRRPSGLPLYALGVLLVLVGSVYWITRWGARIDNTTSVAFYALLFGALAVIGLCLAVTPAGRTWLAGGRPAVDRAQQPR